MRDQTGQYPAPLINGAMSSGNLIDGYVFTDPAAACTAPGSAESAATSLAPGPEVLVSSPGTHDRVAVSGDHAGGTFKDAHDILAAGPWTEAS